MKKNNSNIVIYQNKTGSISFKGDFQRDTIWATQAQMARVFGVLSPAITKHINNIYKVGELEKEATCSKMEQVQMEGGRKIKRIVDFYNLDVIISVGYRINSKLGTTFRKWATKTLKNHLVKGYTVNRHRLAQTSYRLQDLQDTVAFLQRKSKHRLLAGQEKEILSLLSDYAKTLSLLENYDDDNIASTKGIKGRYQLTYETAINVVAAVKKELRAGDLFGKEYGRTLSGIIGNIYQSRQGTDAYPTLEEKAAHLLYFIIKDHPFVDGNKRIASFLFIYLLDRNEYLFKKGGERKINDNALTALTLLIAISNAKEKSRMVKIVTNLLTR